MKRELVIFALGIVILFIFISMFDYNAIVSAVQAAHMEYIGAAILIQIAILLTFAIRLKVIATKHSGLSYLDALKATAVGTFINLATPISKFGGQPAMAYMITKKRRLADSSSIVIMDTVVEMIVSFTAVVMFVIFFWAMIPSELLSVFVIFIIVVGIITAASMKIMLDARIMQRIIMFFATKFKRFKNFKGDYGKIFSDSFRLILENKKIMSISMLLTLIARLLEFSRIWLILAAFGLFMPIHIVIAIWCMMTILSLIPWLPGSLGLLEFGSASALMLFGVVKEIAVSGILIERLVSFWFVLILSYAFIWFFGYNLKKK